MKDLIDEYKESLKITRFQLKGIEVEISVAKINLQNARGRRVTNLKAQIDRLEFDKSTYNQMLSSLKYTLEWLENGRRPGQIRGIEKKDAYYNMRPYDPSIMERYIENKQASMPWDIEKAERIVFSKMDGEIVKTVLETLSERERDALLMSLNGKSIREIGCMLEMPRQTVHNTIKRAKRKIAEIKYKVLEGESL
ncbi:sigma factor-like helix-turn-helix DNA-binding protein [Psychrobacillus sp. FSL K6-1267]|uniref:sigma factor-like helix-turn-helix DNA-binding protein n=1 Tax=Psychrobacillus sp. FSL K6-1267 TaxID=2921543 RepID=UPI0030F97FA8